MSGQKKDSKQKKEQKLKELENEKKQLLKTIEKLSNQSDDN